MEVDWKVEEGRLAREFVFKDFAAAAAFIGDVVPLADGMDHHPDLLLHGYKRVRVMLVTHSEGRVTERDHELARRIDALLEGANC